MCKDQVAGKGKEEWKGGKGRIIDYKQLPSAWAITPTIHCLNGHGWGLKCLTLWHDLELRLGMCMHYILSTK